MEIGYIYVIQAIFIASSLLVTTNTSVSSIDEERPFISLFKLFFIYYFAQNSILIIFIVGYKIFI
jgi:hypothetical protein